MNEGAIYRGYQEALQLAGASDDYLEGQLNYMDCPKCERGRKMMFGRSTADGTLWGQCLSAGCALQLHAKGARPAKPATAPLARLRSTYNPTTVLSKSCALVYSTPNMLRMQDTYNLSEDHLQTLRWDATALRVLFPINAPNGTIRGIQARSYNGRTPKALTMPFDAFSPLVSWYNLDATETLYIVEDMVSAMRLSEYGTSLALLGTHLSIEAAAEISTHAGGRAVIVALDKDAVLACSKLAKDLRGYLPGSDVQWRALQQDPKDMSPADLDAFVNGAGA